MGSEQKIAKGAKDLCERLRVQLDAVLMVVPWKSRIGPRLSCTFADDKFGTGVCNNSARAFLSVQRVIWNRTTWWLAYRPEHIGAALMANWHLGKARFRSDEITPDGHVFGALAVRQCPGAFGTVELFQIG